MHGNPGLFEYFFIALAVAASPCFAAVLGGALLLADGVTTWHSMRQGGTNKPALLLLKAISGAVMVALPFYDIGWAWVVIAVCTAVVINNVIVCRRQRIFWLLTRNDEC